MRLVTRTEAAKTFGVHPKTVERWLQKGALKGYKLGGGRTSPWRIPKKEIDRFLRKSKNWK